MNLNSYVSLVERVNRVEPSPDGGYRVLVRVTFERRRIEMLWAPVIPPDKVSQRHGEE